jgi:hypothetical protein
LEEEFGIIITKFGVDSVTFENEAEATKPSDATTGQEESDVRDAAAVSSPAQTPIVAEVTPTEPQIAIGAASEKPRTETDRLIEYWKNKGWVAVLIILAACVAALAAALKGSEEIVNFLSRAWDWLRRRLRRRANSVLASQAPSQDALFVRLA